MTAELTIKQAERLLQTPKWVVSARGRDGVRLMKQPIPIRDGFSAVDFILVSEDDQNEFRLSASCSEKRALKISIHHQVDPSHIGLLRVDYNGPPHTNPPSASDEVPERFRPHIGARFRPGQPHIHYHVPGYKTLAWAVPLTEDQFPIKSVEADEHVPEAIRAFGAFIALKTDLIPQASDLFDRP